MGKLFLGLLSAAMALSAAAQAASQVTPAATEAKATRTEKCRFPKSRKRAPVWLCDARADGLAMAAVGSAPRSAAGISFMEQMAAADARTRLARSLRRSVQDRIAGRSDVARKKADREGGVITEIATDSVGGARAVKSAYGPDGTLYVLVGIDATEAKRLVESITAEYLARQRR